MEDMDPRCGHSNDSSKAYTSSSFVQLLIKAQKQLSFFVEKQAVRENKDS